MSWLLDTEVICQPAKRKGDPRVIAWLAREKDDCFTSAVVIAQLAYWVRSKEGKERAALQTVSEASGACQCPLPHAVPAAAT